MCVSEKTSLSEGNMLHKPEKGVEFEGSEESSGIFYAVLAGLLQTV